MTDWKGYDSAYTERYLGLPLENQSGYLRSSPVSISDSFPDEEHRLVLAHGLVDENVRFAHTVILVDRLIAAEKPYDLCIFPQERHSFRTWSSVIYEAQHFVEYIHSHL